MYTIKSVKLILIKSDLKALKEALADYDITEVDSFGNNILHYYIKESKNLTLDYKAVIDLVLTKGLDMNAKQSKGPYQRSPLHIAVTMGLKDIAEDLIKRGSDVNATDVNGNSILWTAVMSYRGDGYFIEKLIQNNADIFQKNLKGISPIQLANKIENYDAGKFFSPIN